MEYQWFHGKTGWTLVPDWWLSQNVLIPTVHLQRVFPPGVVSPPMVHENCTTLAADSFVWIVQSSVTRFYFPTKKSYTWSMERKAVSVCGQYAFETMGATGPTKWRVVTAKKYMKKWKFLLKLLCCYFRYFILCRFKGILLFEMTTFNVFTRHFRRVALACQQ